MTTKVLVADDHPLFRQGLVSAIQQEDAFEVIAEAENGLEAFNLIKKEKPDIAVLDISMPKMNGLEIVRKAQKENLNVKCVIITMHKSRELLDKALEAGVKAYLLKENSASDLVTALNFVLEDRCFISPQISEGLIERNSLKQSIDTLTRSEKRILKLIAQKKSSKEIAEELNISFRTVETHRVNISSKLNLHGMNSLVLFSVENKSIIN